MVVAVIRVVCPLLRWKLARPRAEGLTCISLSSDNVNTEAGGGQCGVQGTHSCLCLCFPTGNSDAFPFLRGTH